MKEYYIQHIMDNNLSIFRAYVNGFYWLRHPYYDVDSRNLGYYSPLQTDLSNYFRSLIIDWLQDKKNKNIITEDLLKYIDHKKSINNVTSIIEDFLIKLGTDVMTLTNCIVELYILNSIQRIPIIVYNENHDVIYIFDNGLKYHHVDNTKMTKQQINEFIKTHKNTCIQIRLNFITENTVPDEIDVVYNSTKI